MAMTHTAYKVKLSPTNASVRVVCASFLAVLVFASIVLGRQTAPQETFADRMEMLSIQERTALLNDLANNGGVIPESEYPSAIDYITTANGLHLYIGAATEPFSNSFLDHLESLVASNKDESARFRAAVLLYRHGRQSGRLHLHSLLQDEQDSRSAQVLAHAREVGAEDDIVDIIRTAEPKTARAIVASLYGWRSSELDSALISLVRDGAENPGWTTDQVLDIVSNIAPADVLQRLRDRFDALPVEDAEKLRVAAALRRSVPSETTARTYLRSELLSQSTRGQLWKLHVFNAIASTNEQAWLADIGEAVDHLVEAPANETRDDSVGRLMALAGALDAVISLGGQVDVQIADSIYEQARAVNAIAANRHLEKVFLRSGNAALVDLVRARRSVAEVDRIIAILSLRPVPREYLPKASLEWCSD